LSRPAPSGRPSALEEAAAPPVIELRGIWRTFGTDPPVLALRGVDLTVAAGDWVSVLGPSGSGKSTLLHIVGLLDRPDRGEYRLDGRDVASLGELGRAALRGRRIGFVFQAFHLLPHRSVVENVMLAELYSGLPRQGRRERAREAIARVGLSARAEFVPTRLSGGERQRVAVARAIVGRPSLLLCDEPTGNLDSHSSAALLELFAELSADGMTLLVITHDEAVARRGRRLLRMVDGKLSPGPVAPARAVSAATSNGQR
jgi:putative ABC transport system ATP-binding protein